MKSNKKLIPRTLGALFITLSTIATIALTAKPTLASAGTTTASPVAAGQVVADKVAAPTTKSLPSCPEAKAAESSQSSGQRPAEAKPLALSSSELYQLIAKNPACISNVVFVNGENDVKIELVNKQQATVTVSDAGGKENLLTKLEKANIKFQTEKQSKSLPELLVDIFPLLMFGLLGYILFSSSRQRRQMGGMSRMGNSRSADGGANDSIAKVGFEDVAGCPEAIKELQRLVERRRNASVYDEFGAKLPKGILLVGPPGTGKTLLAKAVANETDGTFEAVSGSEFVQMFVGVGALRVRELFLRGRAQTDKTKHPHIIFIDEIDAVGRQRGSGFSGGNDEREQTLNQLLTEMDGVHSNNGIIVIAATNRVDILDTALLRPGRFDSQVTVDLPDAAGREAIFAIHTKKGPLAGEVTLAGLAQRTFGYSGAEIAGVCNRAFIIAADRHTAKCQELRRSGLSADECEAQLVKEVTKEDFDEAVDFVRYGASDADKQSRMKETDKINTAFHEAGHAVASVVAPEADPVVKITIMRRSRALGYVQTMPDTDRVSITKQQALSRIVMAMAGRAAQEVFLNTVDAGASNDFQQASDMARRMVATWGMSRLGPISVGEQAQGPFGGGGGSSTFGQDLGNEIDREVRYITNMCYKAAVAIVKADSERINALVKILMEKETVLADEWQDLLKQYPSAIDWSALALPQTESNIE